MNQNLKQQIKELRDLTAKIDEVYKPVAHIYDILHDLENEKMEKYREIASELGIEYCKHDQLTIDRLIEYLEK